MVYLPNLQRIDVTPLLATDVLEEMLEEQRRALETVRQLPVQELRISRQAMMSIEPAIQELMRMDDLIQGYRNQMLAAGEAVRELATQMEEIRGMMGSLQSAVDVASNLTPYQWAILAGVTGVSATSPIWMSAPGIAPPISQLPVVTLSDIAMILAGEAGNAASVALDIAIHRVEAVLSDDYRRKLALILVVGVLAWMTNSDRWLNEMKSLSFWAMVVDPIIGWLMEGE